MTAVTQRQEQVVLGTTAPSPFRPIADYAFRSNCQTGALVAPDGAIDWLPSPPGLYAEEFEIEGARHLGSFP